MPGVGIWPSDLMTPFKLAYSFSWAVELFGREPLSHRVNLAVSREPFSWGSICTSQPICGDACTAPPKPAPLQPPAAQACFTVTHKQKDKHRVSLFSGSPKPPKRTKYNKVKSNPRFWRINLQAQTCGGSVCFGTKLAAPHWNCVVQRSLNWHLHGDP